MTSINVAAPKIGNAHSPTGDSGNSTAAKISRLNAQIIKITQQIKDLATSGQPPDVIRKRTEALQEQIQLLQQQINQLIQQDAKKAQEKAEQESIKAGTADVNGSDQKNKKHKIDIYL